MRRVPDLDRFVSNPVGKYFVGRTHVVWCASTTLVGSCSWGRPTGQDARELTRLLDLTHQPAFASYDAITDSTALDSLDWDALSVLREFVKARLPTWGRHIRRQAAVVPQGPMGFILAGLVPLLA